MEQEQRSALVAEALSFLGTPHRDNARLKGVGVDCATFLAEASIRCGLVPKDIEIPHYSPQWHLHRNEELYIKHLLKYTREMIDEEPQPGDIAVWKFARCYSHGAIVVQWPRIVHCVKFIGVHEDDASNSSMLTRDNNKPRPVKFFSYWGR